MIALSHLTRQLKPIYLAALIACLFSIQLSAQLDQSALDKYINEKIKAFDIAGLSIAIVKNGKTDFQGAYGYMNRDKEIPMQEDAVFAIASLSKAFTAAAVGILIDDGKLNWDDKVSQYIEAFDLSDDYVASQMTIEDLLAHRSGFSTFDGDLLWYGTDYTREEIIRRFANYPMSYDFRNQYGYQNIMFIIAGEVVEEVSGKSWDEFITERIFVPLGMGSSYTNVDHLPSNRTALPHVKGKLDKIRSYSNSGGAAAINSNVIDLSKWLNMWLNKGVYNGKTLLKEETYYNIINLQTPIDPSAFDRSNGVNFKGYGLGWFMMDYQGGKLLHHGGGLPGYISKIFFYPDLNLGGVILTNDESSLPASLMHHIVDQYKQNAVREDWAALYLNFSKGYEQQLEEKRSERESKRMKELEASLKSNNLVGDYEDKVYGKAKVEILNGELVFTMLPTKEIFTSKMKHWHMNTYQIRFKDRFLPNGYITFHANTDGEVTGMKVDLPNPDFHFHKLDFRKIIK